MRLKPKYEKNRWGVYQVARLRHRRYRVVGGAHLSQHLVQPLQRTMEVDLYPARRRRHVLSMVLRAPSFDEGHPNRAHLRKLVNGFKTVVNTLRQQLSKLPVIENL